MKRAGMYLRVSTADHEQRPEVQEERLRPYLAGLGYEPIRYNEVGVSGTKTSRPVLDQLLQDVRKHKLKAVGVTTLDRMGRSLPHLLQLLDEFKAHGVRFIIQDAGVDTETAVGRMFVAVQGMFSEFYVSLLKERIDDGIAYSREHGTKSGKPIGRAPLDVDFVTVCEQVASRQEERGSVRRIAAAHGCSPAWIYKHVVPALREQGAWLAEPEGKEEETP